MTYLKAIQHRTQNEWIGNGCKLVWLIDPFTEKIFVYRPNGGVEIVNGFDQHLSGEDVLPGFEFDLSKLKYSIGLYQKQRSRRSNGRLLRCFCIAANGDYFFAVESAGAVLPEFLYSLFRPSTIFCVTSRDGFAKRIPPPRE